MKITKNSVAISSNPVTVNIMDYGAIGDGVRDDAPAILHAAQYVSSIGGGVVYFPKPAISYGMSATVF
jgi:polygalacturonase